MLWLSDHLILSTIILVLLAVGLALVVFRYFHRVYPHESTQIPFATAIVSISVTVLFSVFLNNLFALSRANDDRMRALKDHHFEQLRPTLRRESEQLNGLANEIRQAGRFDSVKEEPERRLRTLRAHFWVDLISQDLERHFPEYNSTKRSLAKDIEAYDVSLLSLVPEIESQVVLPEAHKRWRKDVAFSKAVECSGHGDGMTLTVKDDGRNFNFSYFQGGVGGGGPPAPEYLQALQAYRRLQLAPKLMSACEQVRLTSRALADRVDELASRALFLTYHTALKGSCEFLDSENN